MNVSMPQITDGYGRAGIRGGFQPGTQSIAPNSTINVVMGNGGGGPARPTQGQGFPTGQQ